MRKYIGFLAFLVFFLLSLPAISSAAEGKIVGLLPTNPFYFFKEFRRSIHRVFTFKEIRKVDLELSISDDKVLELEKLTEIIPDDKEVLSKGVMNYKDQLVNLADSLDSLSGTSDDKNVSALLDRVVDATIRHNLFFIGLESEYFSDDNELKSVRERIDDILLSIPERLEPMSAFSFRLQKALLQNSESLESEERAKFYGVVSEISEKSLDSSLNMDLAGIRDSFLPYAVVPVFGDIDSEDNSLNDIEDLLPVFDDDGQLPDSSSKSNRAVFDEEAPSKLPSSALPIEIE
ncbi:MAG: hypothetical protein COU07_02070 [Candidatus Harrisonbacteria bacterium CG10_big_fil_rev_8_21_14_0_10_40_38]|uniref:DUF5667 domain-containing protein n=1 Tax=Candidatus Harrisonbacteria bacterium CG10_big_fil_rev_8_21_14_0_10_40_38 TaxID=1974583 RepID=A0A2H0US34_9BACT|nr:MAG: hypothetical protein COU07_02070 [Candidatus Harrisonbacteria bacterium CG10_big_fil_rev_8_21_14_0_10_40_38]